MSTARRVGLARLGKYSGMTMLRQSIAMLIAFGSSVVLARALGPEGKGIYSVALLVPTTAITLFNAGIGSATVYHLARGAVSPEDALLNNLKLGSLASLLAICAAAAAIHTLSAVLFPGIPTRELYISLIYIPAGMLALQTIAILQGMQEFGAYNLVALVSQLGAFVLSVVMVWILRMDVIGAVLAITAGQVSAVLAAMYAVRRGHARAHTMSSGAYARMVLPYGAAANTKTLIDFGVRHIDVFLVNLFLGPGSAGVYSMAAALAERLSIVSSSPSAVMLPRISELEGSDDIREQVTPVMARHVLCTMLVIGVVVFGLASLFVTVIYGPSFAGAANAFRILVLGTIATSLSHVLATDIAGRGKPQVNARISALSLVITVLLDIVLIPRSGIYGAAAGCSIAWIVGALLTVSYYCRITRVRWTSVLVLLRSDLQRLARVIRTQIGKRLYRGPDLQ